MCGIAGLFSKSLDVSGSLGGHLGEMLLQLSDRGPGQRGRRVLPRARARPAPRRCRCSARPGYDWDSVRAALAGEFGAGEPQLRGSHAVIVVEADAEVAQAWLHEHRPELRVMSAGQTIEIFKEAGPPREFVERFALARPRGQPRARPHADGHREPRDHRALAPVLDRASTSASCTTARCRTTTGLRRRLRREGIEFQTDNDSEVAAGYLTHRMSEGASLEQALEGCLDDLDGFYTFAVGTAEGFAVLRDPIACKPAVMAETDDWVAMASEYRAIAVLPGAENATVWEPEPGSVYSWERAPV